MYEYMIFVTSLGFYPVLRRVLLLRRAHPHLRLRGAAPAPRRRRPSLRKEVIEEDLNSDRLIVKVLIRNLTYL